MAETDSRLEILRRWMCVTLVGAARRSAMSEHGQPTMRRTGLPTPSTVLRETQLRPPARSAVESPHAQAERPITYRILRTNQMDPYDQALTEAEIITLGRERIVGDDFRGTARRAAKLSIANAETEV